METVTSEQLTVKLRQVREGYLTGRTTLFGQSFEIEAFRVAPDAWNEPANKRPVRMLAVLDGLQIDDAPLNQVQIPGHDGNWLMVIYPAENEHYTGSPA